MSKELTATPASVPQRSFADLQRLAASFAKSGLFGVSDPDQALALMAEAEAEGKHPASFMRDNVIISFERRDGTKVHQRAKRSEAMMRDFISNGGKIQWHELTDAKAEATFSHPAGGTIRIVWDMPRAKQAGLTGRTGDMYVKFPRAMLRARCISEGCRTVGPFATGNLYTPEEVRDMQGQTDVTVVRTDAQESEIVQQTVNALTSEEVEQHVDTMSNAQTLAELQAAYTAGHEHAKQARDTAAKKRFLQVYELRSADLGKSAAGSGPSATADLI
jgi:hypothetical protein